MPRPPVGHQGLGRVPHTRVLVSPAGVLSGVLGHAASRAPGPRGACDRPSAGERVGGRLWGCCPGHGGFSEDLVSVDIRVMAGAGRVQVCEHLPGRGARGQLGRGPVGSGPSGPGPETPAVSGAAVASGAFAWRGGLHAGEGVTACSVRWFLGSRRVTRTAAVQPRAPGGSAMRGLVLRVHARRAAQRPETETPRRNPGKLGGARPARDLGRGAGPSGCPRVDAPRVLLLGAPPGVTRCPRPRGPGGALFTETVTLASRGTSLLTPSREQVAVGTFGTGELRGVAPVPSAPPPLRSGCPPDPACSWLPLPSP